MSENGKDKSLYLKRFGLTRHPFATSPDPRFFVKTNSHIDSLARLVYSIRERKGFISLTGNVGTGKTTIINTLLSDLDPNVVFSHITYSDLDFLELLQMICSDFGLSIDGKSKVSLMNELFHFVVNLRLEGKNALVIIDEAQNLSDETLESLRMLSNVETTQEKLLQILICGQPELKDKLKKKRLRQLAQRIVVNIELEPLNEDETLRYIYLRMNIAGANGEFIFPVEIARRIAFTSQGVPRIINILCDNCLLETYLKEEKQVSAKTLHGAERCFFNLYKPAEDEVSDNWEYTGKQSTEDQESKINDVEKEDNIDIMDNILPRKSLFARGGLAIAILLTLISVIIFAMIIFPDLLLFK